MFAADGSHRSRHALGGEEFIELPHRLTVGLDGPGALRYAPVTASGRTAGAGTTLRNPGTR